MCFAQGFLSSWGSEEYFSFCVAANISLNCLGLELATLPVKFVFLFILQAVEASEVKGIVQVFEVWLCEVVTDG